jgi:hypothetical protein
VRWGIEPQAWQKGAAKPAYLLDASVLLLIDATHCVVMDGQSLSHLRMSTSPHWAQDINNEAVYGAHRCATLP